MNFPPRTLLALGVIVVLVCLALGTVLAVLRRRPVARGSMALLAQVILRLVRGDVPNADVMGAIGILALAANALCRILLAASR